MSVKIMVDVDVLEELLDCYDIVKRDDPEYVGTTVMRAEIARARKAK